MRKYNHRTVDYKGISLPVAEWSKELKLDVPNNIIYLRIFKYNWEPEKAFYFPVNCFSKSVRPNITKEMIDNGVEAVHLSMLCRGYFRKENRIRVYKMLNTWYKEFRSENMKAA